VFGPASIFSGALLVALIFLRPDHLLHNFLICLGLFVVCVGTSSVCIVRGTDVKINKAITRASRQFCSSVELMIRQEKNLRTMDHAFRLLILMESLTLVKRMFAV
jgi:hypothetical protein